MQMTRSRKILGTAEVVAAVVVLVLAVVLAPAYTGEQPAETAPATEATEAATADAETQPAETTTEPPTEPPEVGEYTVENYIVLTSDSAMEMYSVAKKRLTEYGETLNALKSRVPEINVYSLLAPTRIAFYGPEEYRTGSHSQTRGIEIANGTMSDDIVKVDAYSHLSRHTDEYIYFPAFH